MRAGCKLPPARRRLLLRLHLLLQIAEPFLKVWPHHFVYEQAEEARDGIPAEITFIRPDDAHRFVRWLQRDSALGDILPVFEIEIVADALVRFGHRDLERA